MPCRRSLLLRAAFCAAALTAGVTNATAQTAQPWPTKPIRLVVPYTPGGLTDVLARLVAQKASVTLGQNIIVENKPGASTVIGSDFVAKSPADGYTLLFSGTTTLTTNPLLLKKLPYKASDFAPVALVGVVPFIGVAHPSVPADDLKSLLAYIKANPGKVMYSTSGQGTSSHLVGEMFEAATGADLTDVPYKGTAPALMAVLSGEVAMTFDGVTLYIPHIQSGKLKPVALFGDQRLSAIDKVPTMTELGYPEALAVAWFGVLAPAATPRAIIDRVNAAISDAMKQPDVVARLRESNVYVEPRSAQAFSEMLKSESARWEKVVKPLNIQLD